MFFFFFVLSLSMNFSYMRNSFKNTLLINKWYTLIMMEGRILFLFSFFHFLFKLTSTFIESSGWCRTCKTHYFLYLFFFKNRSICFTVCGGCVLFVAGGRREIMDFPSFHILDIYFIDPLFSFCLHMILFCLFFSFVFLFV